MECCKHCGSDDLVKNGLVKGKQRYECKACSKTTRIGDERVKYSLEKKIKVIKMYLEGVGIMSIERLEGVPNPLIIYWIRNLSRLLREKLTSTPIPEEAKDIEILELDELFTYCQKKLPECTYGLLLIGTEIKLLTSK